MKAKEIFIQIITALLFSMLGVQYAYSQETYSNKSVTNTGDISQQINAGKLDSEDSINLDGKLDESIWQTVNVATGFTQRTPNDGDPATEKTEARVIYTDDAIYVGFNAYDSAMDSIAATLFRKDGSAYSDWVYVSFDSYDDNRTSFNFAVNPKGIRKDILIFDNDEEDIRWDAVWQAEVQINGNSWTAEMRIPLSQLRYSTKNSKKSWGVNFQRRIARKEEISFWAPTPQDASGFVSQYGELQGLEHLANPRRLELIPYVSSSLTRAPSEPGNPYYEPSDWSGSVGGDLKYGLTSDFTLTATINPDFGQVEADPAVINLSANETYFNEQRPFFLEGNEIFQFGNTKTYNSFGNPLTFYSRRIGRSPQGNLSSYNNYNDRNSYNPEQTEATHINRPDQTTIAAATKISGKTKNGWSIGFLDAYTVKETAPYQVDIGNSTADGEFAVEPATNYMVSRIKKDFNNGNSIIGGFFSATHRDIDGTYFEESLHKSAYLGGIDFEHNWNERDWAVSGTFSLSQVNGNEESILKTQRSSVRYYNRVDSDKLSVNPDRTSLNGYATEVSIRKSGGEHWRSSVTYAEVSPGYETNDLGFENRADYRAISSGMIYEESDPEYLRNYEIWSFQTWSWNHDGDNIGAHYNVGGYGQFKNLWSFNANINYSSEAYLDRLTRSGPIAKRPDQGNFNFNISSNQTKKVSFNIGGYAFRNFPEDNAVRETEHYIWAGVEIRPATNLQISIEPELGFERDTDQYVTTIDDPTATETYGSRYVFADIDQTSLITEIRLDWTFTPEISLQTYARPFISSGNYYNYKEFTTPRKYHFDIYGKDAGTISKSDGSYMIDPDAGGPANSFSVSDGNFNFRSIQTNAVFRWEYAPGSTLFLVWQQDRRSNDRLNDFRFGRDFDRLWKSQPTNIFLIKLSYWISS